MNILEILKLSDKSSVDSLEGVIVELYKPEQQTANQLAKDIHVQNLVVAEGGVSIKVQILSASMHLPPKSKGQRVRFSGDKGLSVNIYAPPGKDARISVNVGKYASIKVSDNGAAKPQADQPATAKASNASPQRGGEPDMVSLIRHTEVLAGIAAAYAERYEALSNNPCDADTAQRAASTVYIYATRIGLIPDVMGVAGSKVAEEKPAEAEATEATTEPTVGTAEAEAKVAKSCLEGSITSKNIEKVERFLFSSGGHWVTVYDVITENLEKVRSIPRSSIDQIHDDQYELLTRKLGVNEEAIYREICRGITDLIPLMETEATPSTQPSNPLTKTDDDEIPF